MRPAPVALRLALASPRTSLTKATVMYIRFITPRRVAAARGAAAGIFRAGYNLWCDETNPDWLRNALRSELDWFNANLRVPNRLGVVTRKSNRRYGGVCWFKDGARDCVAHAYLLSALLREAGLPVSRIATEKPGDIVYRDAHQIVAMPRSSTPTVWH